MGRKPTGPKKDVSSTDKGKEVLAKRAKALARLKIDYVPIDSVHPNDYNNNVQDEKEYEMLKRSILDEGFTVPILVHKRTNEIVDGEHRWRIMKELGETEIPVVFTIMTREQQRIATIRHNLARGKADVDATAQIYKDLEMLGALKMLEESILISSEEIDNVMALVRAGDDLINDVIFEPQIAEDDDEPVTDATTEKRKAVEEDRDYERKLAEARSANEHKARLEDNNFFRLNLVFIEEEADLVKRVLGNAQAEKLVQMCRKEEV